LNSSTKKKEEDFIKSLTPKPTKQTYNPFLQSLTQTEDEDEDDKALRESLKKMDVSEENKSLKDKINQLFDLTNQFEQQVEKNSQLEQPKTTTPIQQPITTESSHSIDVNKPVTSNPTPASIFTIDQLVGNATIIQQFINKCISKDLNVTKDILKKDLSYLKVYFTNNIDKDNKVKQNKVFINHDIYIGFLVNLNHTGKTDKFKRKELKDSSMMININDDLISSDLQVNYLNSITTTTTVKLSDILKYDQIKPIMVGHTQENIVNGGIDIDVFNNNSNYNLGEVKSLMKIKMDDNLTIIRLYFIIKLIYKDLFSFTTKNINNILLTTLATLLIFDNTVTITCADKTFLKSIITKHIFNTNDIRFSVGGKPSDTNQMVMLQKKDNILYQLIPSEYAPIDRLKLFIVIANYKFICNSIINHVEKNFKGKTYYFTSRKDKEKAKFAITI